MPQGLRFEPTTVRHDRVVSRDRLTRLLNTRFEHRVTAVTGAAGFGKTTALALAVDNNRLDPIGRDVWLTVTPTATSATALLSGLATALDVEPAAALEATVDRVADAVWTAAPDDVALIIDDAHLLQPDAMAALGALLPALPTNGHLVFGSRSRIDLPLARLRSHGQLLEIGEEDLALDDEELAALARRGTVDDARAGVLPRHVATADLQLAAGIDASAEFLWEEVLADLDSDRLAHLRRCSVLDELDDEVVSAVTDGAFDAAGLVSGLPLVERFEHGRRMHAILREALRQRLEPGEQRKTLSIAAEAEAARGNLPAAVRLFDAAGDPISALDAARDFAAAPTMEQTVDDVTSTRRIVNAINPDAPVIKMLDALARFAGLDAQVAPMLMEAAAAARAAGDTHLEVAALQRAGQSLLLHHSPDFHEPYDRLEALRDTDDIAVGVHAYFTTILDQLDGRPDDAVAHLADVALLGRSTELSVRAERLYDLGRPEEVAVGLTAEDLAIMPPGATAFIGIAIWTRGDSTPEGSLRAVRDSIEQARRSRYTHPLVSTLCTGAAIALAAGEADLAARWAEQAAEVAVSGVGAAIGEGVVIAQASVASTLEGDDAAAALMQRDGPGFEYSEDDGPPTWPSRAKLVALPLTYLCRPDLREMLDGARLGPSLTTAVSAGRALVALRDANDAEPAAALPWGRVNLLRAHVLPHHLVELACAAISTGNQTARELLDAIPHMTDVLERVAQEYPTRAADTATSILGSTPRPEPFRLHALTLGGVTLQRNGIEVEASAFTRRPKVRELFGLLVERRTLTRAEIVGLLWGEHDDDDKAQSSLRTALSTLNDVLEPRRDRGQAAFHLHAEVDTISLDSRVTTDLVEFEAAIAAAQADDAAGLPSSALRRYREALELYRGDYLHGIEASWIVLTRLRLRTLAVGALCRVAELTAAKGEPEDAARWAAQARTIDPLSERAGRLFVAALEATGDRSVARNAADELRSTLSAADLAPSPATARLLDRLS